MSSTSDFPSLLLAAVNNERAAHGLPPLCMNTKLHSAAQKHSDDMAKNNFLSRIGSSGSSMSHRITASGFQWSAIAENVFAGQKDVVTVMNWLKRSADYEKNILSTTYKMFGCDYAYNPKSTHKHFWTLYFALGSTESCSNPVTFSWQAPTTQTEILTNKKPNPVIKMPTSAIELPDIQKPAMETPTSTNKAPALTHSGSIHKKMPSAVNKQRVAVGLRPLCMNAKLH
ncbi:hypothetical protein PsorP6_012428 [Peronosclerospora sorghi]|uniref:Uncharacterized protein n=1 Tax=Peronosclerospora sorghi TaxID=230839 RepID=A0ACC0WFZ6_9STRA|nr:hypothetical protein PsorP6_012428 [Peronosclerospora sorghi]